MGLDVSAYSKVTLIAASGTPACDWDKLDNGNRADLYNNSDFTERAGGMVEGIYDAEGCVRVFSSGYGHYNRFREQVAALVGKTCNEMWQVDTKGPFWEFVNFSDCEGFIGTTVCAKLADDFERYHDIAKNRLDTWELKQYESFMRAFRLASVAGVVWYH